MEDLIATEFSCTGLEEENKDEEEVKPHLSNLLFK
jgi:hypothetical protein